MVILLDLNRDAVDLSIDRPPLKHHCWEPSETQASEDTSDGWEERPNPNDNSFSAALSCYPIVFQIASQLDLNTLHDLSATCRQFRVNLLQFRDQLVKQTLRCINDSDGRTAGLRQCKEEPWSLSYQFTGHSHLRGHGIRSGRGGSCARDMVGECRRCGTVVCRNCILTSPSSKSLRGRHRRLCKACSKSPLIYHTWPFPEHSAAMFEPAFTAPAFSRNPCSCELSAFICRPCSTSLSSADTTYMRGWTWRTRYSTYLGGLGTGIGEGNEGVECGRGDSCLAAKEVEKEIDCDAEELADLRREIEQVEKQGQEGRRWGGTSYLTQEIEGIGGVVKKKVKKRIRVGAVVKEYEDERETGECLERERVGKNRSWCSWCCRVVVSVKDDVSSINGAKLRLTPSSSSSEKSCR